MRALRYGSGPGDRSWTVEEIRDIEDTVRTRVGGKVRGVRRVKVRFMPKEAEVKPMFDEFIPGDVSPPPSPEPEEHDHDHTNGNGHHHKH